MSEQPSPRKSRRSINAPPGTIRIDPDAPPPRISVLAYGPDDYVEQELASPEDLPDLLEQWPVVWINVDGLGDESVLLKLAEIFRLHRLAMEDVTSVSQRAKVEQYDGRCFMVMRMSYLREGLQLEQLSVFLGDGFVVTFQQRRGDCLDPVRERIRKGAGRIRRAKADYLAYALLDAVVDGYFPVLEDYGERLERLEAEVIRHPVRDVVGKIHRAKRELMSLRRAIWPLREMFSSLVRDPIPQISDETRVYFRDCYDHVTQIIDMLETDRELASGLMDVYMSGVSNRMNEVMKVLTIIATIFIPLSFIAGVYGMNFDPDASPWNMPELGWRYGYPAVLAVFAVVAGGMLWYFRRKGWLGGGDRPPDEAGDHPRETRDEHD